MIGRNNPFNLERNSIKWDGELPGVGRFADFDSMAAGVRAGLRVVANKQRLHGCKTVEEVVADFARNKPGDHNDLVAYAAYMAKGLGKAPGDAIDLTDPATLSRWGDLQAWFESKTDLMSSLGAGLIDVARSALGLS